jgi:hypothetical protein
MHVILSVFHVVSFDQQTRICESRRDRDRGWVVLSFIFTIAWPVVLLVFACSVLRLVILVLVDGVGFPVIAFISVVPL